MASRQNLVLARMKYRLQSRRKYFYNCPICALVYITAKALKAHYAAVHPNLPCEVDELATGKSVMTECKQFI